MAAQQLIVDTHDAHLRVIEYIDNSKPQTMTGALEFADAKSGLPKYGLISSIKGLFWDWAYGNSTKPSEVAGIVMTGGPGGASAKDIVVNLGDPSKGNDPVLATCGDYTVDIVGADTTLSEDLTLSEGTDAVVFVR